MALIENFTPRRPRKETGAARSGVASALATPQPPGLEEALTAFLEAKRLQEQAVEACIQSRGPSGAALKERALSDARKALMAAQTAVELDEPDAPSPEALAKIHAEFERAKADVDNIAARLEALEQIEERRHEALIAAHDHLHGVIRSWKQPVIEAVEQQTRDAAQRIAEATAAAKAVRVWETYSFGPIDLPNYAGGDRIRLEAEVSIPDGIARAVVAARSGFKVSRPPVGNGPTVISGTMELRR